MPWIDYIDEKYAKGELKEIYKNIKNKRGKLSNLMKIHSLNPKTMQKHMDLYLSIMFGKSNLSRQERELIAIIVSSLNNCNYCINHHKEALNYYWKDINKIDKLIKNFNKKYLSEKNKAMIEYVYKLTKNPDQIRINDIDLLKKKDFSDRDILDINLITSYFNFVNRIVLGLGVEYSDDEIKGYTY
jgi:uncharacterized peroxidase-related enzyme